MISRFNFITILLIGFVDFLGIGLVYPVFASLLFDPSYPMIADGSSSAYRGALLGILIALTPLTQFFSSSVLGAYSDIKGRKKTLLFGISVGSLGYVIAVIGIWTYSLPLLFLYRIFVGISASTVGVAQAMIADISTEKNKTRRFALFNASLGFGFTIGPFLGGKLVDPSLGSWCGYATPFMAAIIMCAINLLMILYKFPETRAAHENITFNLWQGLNNLSKIFMWKRLRWLFFATFSFCFGWSFFNEFMPVLLRERFGFSPGDIGNYYAYGGGWYALSAGIAIAPLLKYFKAEKIVVKALIGSALCMLAFIVIPDAKYIWWILPFLMCFQSATFPSTAAIVSNQASDANQGEVLGAHQSVIAAAMGLSPLLIGSAIGAYPELTAWGSAFTLLLASAAFWKGCRVIFTKMEVAND